MLPANQQCLVFSGTMCVELLPTHPHSICKESQALGLPSHFHPPQGWGENLPLSGRPHLSYVSAKIPLPVAKFGKQVQRMQIGFEHPQGYCVVTSDISSILAGRQKDHCASSAQVNSSSFLPREDSFFIKGIYSSINAPGHATFSCSEASLYHRRCTRLLKGSANLLTSFKIHTASKSRFFICTLQGHLTTCLLE